MKGRWAKYLMTGAMVAILAACSSKPTDRGQQYKDGKLSQPFSLVNQPDAVGAPINAGDFSEQVYQIRTASPRLYGSQNNVYSAVQDWLRAGGDTRNMRQFGIDAWQMEGADNYGNVQFTGYYTPVVQGATHTPGRVPVSHLPYAAETRSSAVPRRDLRWRAERKLRAGLQQLPDGQLHYGRAGQRLY